MIAFTLLSSPYSTFKLPIKLSCLKMSMKTVKKVAEVVLKFAGEQWESVTSQVGPPLGEFLGLPIKIIVAPFAIGVGAVENVNRGFGIPELASRLSFSAVFLVAAAGTFEVTFELGKKVLCRRGCKTCSSWQALWCTMCKGWRQFNFFGWQKTEGPRLYMVQIKKFKDHMETILVRGQLLSMWQVRLLISLSVPLPLTDCPTCDGTKVMHCPHCKDGFQFRISADNIMEPPWVAAEIMRKMDYPYEKS